MSNNYFTEAELNRASLAGLSRASLEVAKEYPESSFGEELRKHFKWGYIDRMVEDRRENGDDAEPTQYWLGGGFSTALAFGPLRNAYGAADRQNIRILVDLFGVPSDVHCVTDEVVADVEAGHILIYEMEKEASA